jgi:hypothetical protein
MEDEATVPDEMTSARFDDLARKVARVSSRRSAIGASFMAVVGGISRSHALAARCRRVGATCNGATECCIGLQCAPIGPGNKRVCIEVLPPPPPPE